MKTFFTIIFVTLSLVSFSLSQTSSYAKAPKPVDYVNTKNFSGLWYEIARTYNSFEKDCVAATVEYKYINNSKYDVINRCFKHEIGAELIVYNGTAEPSNGNTMAQIEKTYFWIFSKEYRIIYLDENYKLAIMADDQMENVWIMYREPFLDKEKLNEMVSLLDKYMDTSRLIYTPQDKNGRYK